MKKDTEDYRKMQKEYYENPKLSPEHIVGNYEWHEEFPYETQLLYKNGDLRIPLVLDAKNKVALDFGCGPGRMVGRMSKIFKRVDGVDISANLIALAKKNHPQSNFYVSSGTDLGNISANTYDFVYSTIALQHIAVHEIRMKIFKDLHRALKQGGVMTVQMAFNPEYPFIRKRKEIKTKDFRLKLMQRVDFHAGWDKNKTDASQTNSGCDVAINKEDLAKVKADMSSIFKDVSIWFYDVSLIYDDLNDKRHAAKYWPTHWIFIHGKK